jgi:hypothetical protein
MDDRCYCLECGAEVGTDGWCPDCGDAIEDAWDDTGGDPDPGNELDKEVT